MPVEFTADNKIQVALGYEDTVLVPSRSDCTLNNCEILYQPKDEQTHKDYVGKSYTEIDEPVVSLQFTGPNAIRALDILIEDLQEIRLNLKRMKTKV